ncbi:UvrD-helicase domain-containing protein [Chloroflexota bacterium]
MMSLRPEQQKILEYAQGKMGISAVPGSGKTYTLSLLAADLIKRRVLKDEQELLVVTLVNSAVDNFYLRVNQFVSEAGLIPFIGYRVRTLHGLAYDIVRERPSLVGLSEDFSIIDEREANSIVREAVLVWLHGHPDVMEGYLNPDLKIGQLERIRRRDLRELLFEIAVSFIRMAKNMRKSPVQIRERLDALSVPLPLAEMGSEIYADYQRSLAYRGSVDFDDLIIMALLALESDEEFLERLRYRWPYVLEDEAQDSSLLQEAILAKLIGNGGNWVRVGDPNQAIFETFTTADPRYLRDYIDREDVINKTLSRSGRSTPSIIFLANEFASWTHKKHQVAEVRDALQDDPIIKPTLPDDPQTNPVDEPSQIHLIYTPYTAKDEISAVADSLTHWVPDHKDWTVAVLVPRNMRGKELGEELQRRKIDCDDSLLGTTSKTRHSAGVLGHILAYLSDPGSKEKLIRVFKDWSSIREQKEKINDRTKKTIELLRKINHLEDFIFPDPGKDWLEELDLQGKDSDLYETLIVFREEIRKWQASVFLPIDQLVLTLAQDFFSEANELAIAHKLAVLLRQASISNPSWRLPQLTEELTVIARNERRFLGFSAQDSGFDPEQYKGIVVITTMHKAKGLEWDRVYLMSINNYNFPSGFGDEGYIAEKWYIRDKLNMQAETLAQLETAFSSNDYEWYQEGDATQKARIDYVRERLRLLYVGITRAKKELVITWNKGRRNNQKVALPFAALGSIWEDHINSPEGN